MGGGAVRLKVSVMVAAGPSAIQAAKQATKTIPIVMAAVADPVAAGFVASLARPGGNITGLSEMEPELVGKQLELLKEVVPKVSRAADALERHLRHKPTRVSKSRIKRLKGLSQPQYRLRGGEVRVFYDVTREAVEVLAIITKAEAAGWLAKHGTPGAPGGAG